MDIGIIGVGRLGICFALLLDRGGYRVRASDIRTNYVAALQQRQIRSNEPGVADLLQTSTIDFTTDTRRVIQDSDVIYVMVATPSRADGSYDISAVERVVEDVTESDFDLAGKILVIGCTVNPGDCQRLQDRLRDRGISVLYNPEFIAQGSIIQDLESADMVLIGGEDPEVITRYAPIYSAIQPHRRANIQTMSLTAAEIVKIGINCFLTTKISYANMMGEVLARSGLDHDIEAALQAIGSDSRIGNRYLRYGFGFGGPCFPRDNRAFAHYAKSIGLDFPLGSIVDQFNRAHSGFLAQRMIEQNTGSRPFYMRSITYKPNTDIVEESQQLVVCQIFLEQGYRVFVEPDDLLPAAVKQELRSKWGDKIQFRARHDLDVAGVDYLEVKI